MIATLIAATTYGAIQFLAPPPAYLAAGLKTNPTVVTTPWEGVPQLCYALGDTHALDKGIGPLLGCHVAQGNIIVQPTPETFPWDDACYRQVFRHEVAHAGDWPANHPGGRIVICHPRKP